ncbi:MAG: hypothetical protein HRT72_03845 [Flavobacteriales bacterium]|nr:hypothetical protein [Flavobacteriales bacterium]
MKNIIKTNLILLLIVLIGVAIFGESCYGKSDDIKISDKNAQKLYIKGDYAKAIYVYRELHKDNPQNTFFSYMLGVCFFEIGDQNDLALSNLARSVEGMGSFINSSPSDAHYYYALSLHKDTQYDKSIDHLVKYRSFVEEDLDYETAQIQYHFGGEITDKNKDRYENMVNSDSSIGHINEVITKINEEIAKNKKLIRTEIAEIEK